MTSKQKRYSVAEATEYLKSYGVSKNEQQTRRLIKTKGLKAHWNGKPNDYRAGLHILKKDLDSFIEKTISDLSKVKKVKQKNKIGELLSTTEAFEFLNKKGLLTNDSRTSFNKWANDGIVPSVSINGIKKFVKEELEVFAMQHIAKNDEPGYVYLLRDKKENVYKIGKTKNAVYYRLKAIENSEKRELEIVHFFHSENAYLTERLLHHYFHLKKCITKRDWFSLDNKDLNWFLDEKFRKLENINKSLLKNNK